MERALGVMTRINIGIPPANLTRQHLLAEHREIKRIPNMVASGKANLENIPAKFTLGTGHVKFFYNKLWYLLDRYMQIYAECINRGYKVQLYESCWNGIPEHLLQHWEPTEDDISLIKQRIISRGGTI